MIGKRVRGEQIGLGCGPHERPTAVYGLDPQEASRPPQVHEVDGRANHRRQPRGGVEHGHWLERRIEEDRNVEIAVGAALPAGVAAIEPCPQEPPAWESSLQFTLKNVGKRIESERHVQIIISKPKAGRGAGQEMRFADTMITARLPSVK